MKNEDTKSRFAERQVATEPWQDFADYMGSQSREYLTLSKAAKSPIERAHLLGLSVGYLNASTAAMVFIMERMDAEDEQREVCPDCGEHVAPCSCGRKLCAGCGLPVGSIVVTACDKCCPSA